MSVHLAVRRAIRLHAEGQLTVAVSAYRAILERHPGTCVCWSNLGMALRALGKKEEGLQALRDGLRVCPQVPDFNYNLGNALKEARDQEGALECYRAAFTRDPGHLNAARACGVLLVRLARFQYEGSYAPRFVRGRPGQLSSHAYGSAFDINRRWNRLGHLPPPAGAEGSVRELVDIANAHGFFWGGHFKGRPDGMHFEVAKLL